MAIRINPVTEKVQDLIQGLFTRMYSNDEHVVEVVMGEMDYMLVMPHLKEVFDKCRRSDKKYYRGYRGTLKNADLFVREEEIGIMLRGSGGGDVSVSRKGVLDATENG